MTTKAAAKRYEAIRQLIERFIDDENGYQLRPDTTVQRVVDAIEELRGLGRTERWSHNLNRWQGMAEMGNDYVDDAATWKRHMHWALIQGSVYVGYAAE